MPSKRSKIEVQIPIRGETKPEVFDRLAPLPKPTVINLTATPITPNYSSSRKRKASEDSTNSSNELLFKTFDLFLTTSPQKKARTKNPQAKNPREKKPREKVGYAPPSTFEHLDHLPRALAPNLICVFVGSNPGVKSATEGHYFSHRTNRFWSMLYSSGCTPRLCNAVEDQELPGLYALGFTDLVPRPTRTQSQLSSAERISGVNPLEDKIRQFQPEAVCIMGKDNWKKVWRAKHGRGFKEDEFEYGWQYEILGSKPQANYSSLKEEDEDGPSTSYPGARVFVATNTSGSNTGIPTAVKQAIWNVLGDWVKLRRAERDAMQSLL